MRSIVFKGKLYPYQQPVVPHFAQRGSLLLAFTQGTGKTPTAIACAEYLMDEGSVSLCLIICPAALKFQWEERLHQFTDTHVTVIDGDKLTRSTQYDTILKYNRHYIVISYDYVLFDSDYMSKLHPQMVVLDEASAIKSFKTQRSKKIKKVFKDVPYRMALTGTPIENRPEELYSIMQWVDSSVLGRYDLFEKAYVIRHAKGWVRAYKNLDVLNERMGDSMIRKSRYDTDVSPYLPEVLESNWYVPLDPAIENIYKDIAKDMLDELARIPKHKVDLRYGFMEAEDSGPSGRLMAMHMCLEMLLCHPSLIKWSADKYLSDDPEGSEYAYLLSKSEKLDKLPTPKLDMLKEELAIILQDPNSKVLIYSKYKEMIRILSTQLPYGSVIFTGEMSVKDREKSRKTFSEQPSTRLFLSSYAGGYGLDMNMADYLINYDHPWSFGTQDQINSRHVRASSVFSSVFVKNMLVLGSIEERKMRVLDRKRRMSDLAIDGAAGSGMVQLDADFLRDHLESIRSNC
jgi:SNF2 family DNA or RNA helicase